MKHNQSALTVFFTVLFKPNSPFQRNIIFQIFVMSSKKFQNHSNDDRISCSVRTTSLAVPPPPRLNRSFTRSTVVDLLELTFFARLDPPQIGNILVALLFFLSRNLAGENDRNRRVSRRAKARGKSTASHGKPLQRQNYVIYIAHYFCVRRKNSKCTIITESTTIIK
jgi:hypothetical protein